MKQNNFILGILIFIVLLVLAGFTRISTPVVHETNYRGHDYVYFANSSLTHAGHCKGIHKVQTN